MSWLTENVIPLVVLTGVSGGLAATFGILAGFAAHQEAVVANEAAAKANERAAELGIKTEQLKADNLALEEKIAPRRLSANDIEASAVEPFPNSEISIWSYGVDVEGRLLAMQIKSALESVAAPGTEVIIDRIGAMLSSTTPRIGVIITGPDDELVTALLKALKPLSAVRGPLPGGSAPAQTVPPAEIFVGIKPLNP
jgi:hypothetical protein